MSVVKSSEHREMTPLIHNKPVVLVQKCSVQACCMVCFPTHPSLNVYNQAEMLRSHNTDRSCVLFCFFETLILLIKMLSLLSSFKSKVKTILKQRLDFLENNGRVFVCVVSDHLFNSAKDN